MKTSNKLLLAIFFGILILTTTVQLMVYAKYKRGDYTAFQREEYYPLTKFSLSPVRFVSITGLGNCAIRNSDSMKLEVQDYKDGDIVYSVKNDTLMIGVSNKVVIGKSSSERVPQNYKLVNVYLPATVTVKAAYSNINLAGGADTLSAPSYTVNIRENAMLYLIGNSRESKSKYFNQLHISGESSRINLDDHAFINSLHLQLVNSSIDDRHASISNLSVDADSLSTISLSGKNVKAIK